MLKKYMFFIMVLTGISIVLGMSYSNFIVTSENHKVAEMYIGTLKYSMTIDGSTTNTLSVPNGETIVDVTITNENPIDTYYKLIYQNNSNVTIKYYESTKDTNDNVINYNSPNDKITANNTNTIKLKIVNNSTSSQTVTFKIVGGFATNTLNDVTVPTGYTIINTVETPSSNTYFCTTTGTLTQGLKYVNGQYTYAYKQQGTWASSGLAWNNISDNGWGIQLTDKTSNDAVTSKVCTYINNKPITSMRYMFYSSQATTLDVSNFDTSKVTNMSYMFSYSKATTLNLSNFDTSKVTNMYYMFYDSQATTIDLSNFDTSNVTNMYYMFQGSQATTLDVSNFNTSNVTSMSGMFYNSQATTLDLSSFDTSKVSEMAYMFRGATNLKTIYVSSKFVITAVTDSTNMFYNCTNLVGGAGTKYNIAYVDITYARIDGGTSNPGYFTSIPEPNSFSSDSWMTIAKAVKSGNISKYNVGDTKSVTLTTYGTHTLRIANKSTPSECSTTGFSQSACGFVLEFADIITRHNMNPSGTYNGTQYDYGWNVGGWPATSMRTFVNNDIYNALPSDLRSTIIDTVTVSGHGNTSGETNFTSTDKLYLLSTAEVWANGYTYDTARDVTRQLDYYKNLGATTTSNYSGAIKKNGTTASSWWLRTSSSKNDNFFNLVTNNGDCNVSRAHSANNVSPAFRIG